MSALAAGELSALSTQRALPREQSGPDRRLRVLERPARRPRTLYGVIAVLCALLIGGAQMWLSVLTTQSSYELADLTAQQRSLDWSKQMLKDDLAGLSSPQYLAANAAAWGMVVGQEPSYLRLSDAAIIGTGAGAGGASAVHALTRAAVPNTLIGGVPLVSDPSSSLGAGASVEDAAIANTTTPPAIAEGLPTPATH